ncbi:putative receptor-like protein kinase [Hibiscus syriacus]|uniref:non-specific serine/threonine protein kinase n=1 Tax=Hibiscus syriacus TaxID=106335 RepID=A0A6A2ZVD1_HIBSY|nr:probable serine/threonine-protein kinase At1g01540 [Hibiscus syriacus]KAE8695102.1 putative receptor-like protein kinase [Hibiscus syriacus]
MSDRKTGFMADTLSKTTSIFGLRLWAVLGVCVGAAFVLFLFLISLWLASKRTKRKPCSKPRIPVVSKEIKFEPRKPHRTQIQTDPDPDPSAGMERQALLLPLEEESPTGYRGIHIEIGKDHRISYPGLSPQTSGEERVAGPAPEVSHLGWGHWYTLRELEVSTNGFAHEKVIGEGGYGIVYHGILEDNSQVAVKNLLNNRGQAEKEFKVEVEAIGRVRHKNLVRLIGYCAEGAHRMLVYEYVNNGNLEQWLHGGVGPCSPLTWDIRMNIILGTAKGLAYLHEGLEPKVVHRDIKSSNILLDKRWNPKVSDFGLAKLLGSESSYITTRVMGTFGYVAPEYASTGMLNERSDVYSFGILIMEILTGRNPVDYSRLPEEVNLIEWLKKMVANRNPEGVLDPKLPEKPTSRALKRALLVALRCVDPNAQKRPKMGHVIHMLEAEESPSKEDSSRAGRDAGQVHCDSMKNESTEKRGADWDGHEVEAHADGA